jgi:HK97 family phage major capsid protein
MPKLHELRERRASRVTEMQGLVAAAEAASRDLNEQEAQRFDSLKGEIRGLDEQIGRAETLAELERRSAADPIHEGGGFEALERRVSLLSMLRSAVEGRPMSGVEAEFQQEVERRTGRRAQGFFYPLAGLAPRSDFETRVGTTTSLSELVPVDHRGDLWIEPFRRRLLTRRLGARVIAGLRGDVAIPRGSGLTAAWVSENEAIPESNLSPDSVTLTPRHCGGLTELSRQLIQQSSPDAEDLVRTDLAAVIAEAIDSAAINGDGVKEPLGIVNTSGVLAGTMAGPTWGQVAAMVSAIEERETPNEPQWVLGSKAARVLRTTTKTAANMAFLYESGQIGDLPAQASGKVEEGASVGTAILGDWSQLLVGVWSELDILVNPYESTAYRRGGVLIRGMATVDTVARAPEAFVVADDIPAA